MKAADPRTCRVVAISNGGEHLRDDRELRPYRQVQGDRPEQSLDRSFGEIFTFLVP
jgi:hypothetical protein